MITRDKLLGWNIFIRTANSFSVDWRHKDWPEFRNNERCILEQCVCLNNILTKELKEYKNESYKKHHRPKKRTLLNFNRRKKRDIRSSERDRSEQVGGTHNPDRSVRNGLRKNEEAGTERPIHGLKKEMRYMNVEEASEFMRVSERTLRSLIAEGLIRYARIGSRIVIPSYCIDEFIESKLTEVSNGE